MAKTDVDPDRTMTVEMNGPLWLVQNLANRLAGHNQREPLHAPDGRECSWSCHVKNNAPSFAWEDPYGKIRNFGASQWDTASAKFTVNIPPPAPPKPSIPDLIAKWRETFAPEDRKALWKALHGDVAGLSCGYALGGATYRVGVRKTLEGDNSYLIEVW